MKTADENIKGCIYARKILFILCLVVMILKAEQYVNARSTRFVTSSDYCFSLNSEATPFHSSFKTIFRNIYPPNIKICISSEKNNTNLYIYIYKTRCLLNKKYSVKKSIFGFFWILWNMWMKFPGLMFRYVTARTKEVAVTNCNSTQPKLHIFYLITTAFLHFWNSKYLQFMASNI